MNKHIEIITTNLLVMQYNVGLVILTALLWSLCFYFGYWDKNFDMLSTIESYIVGLSLVSILIGALGHSRWQKLIKLGIITKIAAIFTLAASKSVITSVAGVWLLTPISIFCFFVLLKNIWIASKGKS